MKSLENFKKNELYDRLFKSIDETFAKKSVIPENERICFCINMDNEAVQKKLDAHKAQCRKKYGTDEGITLFNINLSPSEAKAGSKK